jgi:chromosome segregation ATPase
MASKQAYQQKLEAQLNEWDARLDVLSARARKATADARISYENELEALKAKRAAAHEKLQDLGQRGETAWEDMKDGLEKAWDDMRAALDKVADRLK